MKKYLALISTALLLAACTADPEENNDSESQEVDTSESSQEVDTSESSQESEENSEPSEWHIDQSSSFWNGSTLTLGQEEAILEFPLPETLVVSSTTFELAQAENYLVTEAIKQYEVFVPQGINYDGEAQPFQNELFKSEEVEGGTFFTSEDLKGSENYDYLAPQSLHIYETSKDMLEIVVFDEFSTFILAFAEAQPNGDYQEISLSYDAIHDHLKLMTPSGITLAQNELQEVSSLIPDSKLVPFHQQLIDQARAYITAKSQSDSEAMEEAIHVMSEVKYANLKGVFDSYLSDHENIAS